MTFGAEEMELWSQCVDLGASSIPVVFGLNSLRETRTVQQTSSSQGSRCGCTRGVHAFLVQNSAGERRQDYPPLGQQTLRPLASECDNCKQRPGPTHPLNQLRQLAAGVLQSKKKKKKQARETDLIESPRGMKVHITELLVEKVPQVAPSS